MSARDAIQTLYGRYRPFEDIQAHEWARLARARTVTGAKLAALLPAWLRAHISRSRLPEPFKPDFRVALPRLGTFHTDPRIGYYFPGGQQARIRDHQGEKWEPRERAVKGADMHSTENAALYVSRFCRLNHLTGSTS